MLVVGSQRVKKELSLIFKQKYAKYDEKMIKENLKKLINKLVLKFISMVSKS